MSRPVVSIVVPVYNVEKYLGACLDSIISQCYSDFEVIMIDDGSTDKSGRICDGYTKEDSRFKVIHKQNSGVSSARNIGIEKAAGKYCCFVDADDILMNDYLSSLIYVLEKYDADSSVGCFLHFDNCSESDIVGVPKGVIDRDESIRRFYVKEGCDMQRYLWNRLFKVEIINQYHIRFREDIYYKEDGLFLIDYLCLSNGTVACTERVIYKYRQSDNSAMGKIRYGFNKRFLSNVSAHKNIVLTIKKYCSKDNIQLSESFAMGCFEWLIDVRGSYRDFSLSELFFIESEIKECLGWRKYVPWVIKRYLGFVKSFTKR